MTAIANATCESPTGLVPSGGQNMALSHPRERPSGWERRAIDRSSTVCGDRRYSVGVSKSMKKSDAELAREAKAIFALAFRNGPIEDVHAGKVCPVLWFTRLLADH